MACAPPAARWDLAFEVVSVESTSAALLPCIVSILRTSHPRPANRTCPAASQLQPWRTDLGGCQRKATAKAAGHSEKAVLEMLACDKMLRMGGFHVVLWLGLAATHRIRLADRAWGLLETN